MVDIKKTAKELVASYQIEQPSFRRELALPDKAEIVRVIEELRRLMFPSCYGGQEAREDLVHFAESTLHTVYFRLKKQIELALSFECECKADAEEVTAAFLNALPELRRVLYTDLAATFEGDPAAKSKEEIIFSYPGFYAIFVYRLAHILYLSKVPFIPRMMTEHAHEKTGIDINPGATIGEYFFIDHGTGVVIGETTVIGKRVKIYQMVTLGALSPRKGQSLKGVKRHPTVMDDVTVYSGASILGGETVIGEGAVIGGNCFLTQSVQAGARVSAKQPELIIK
ncbi:MAG: serine acetyltransferase [Clostridia bacterium]|nr:serine acetyltransferase [Clostridia bacterium]